MSIKTISFPLNDRRSNPKLPVTSHLSLKNHPHHPAPSLQHTTSNKTLFPVVSTTTNGSSKPRPYHLNDFANNHLFIAKRKIAQAFHEQSNRNAQSTNDLLYLFDQQESKPKNRTINKPKRRESMMNKSSSNDQNIHLSVLNLRVSPPYSTTQTRAQLSTGLIRPFELWSGVKNLSSA
ncbi:hypothetical protein I4U23_007845 [Adineta vaga]|nr:hypothetical protein I4U23_007845 [Adineta vaga]